MTLAKFLPHNIQEFENEMRALIASHQGLGSGNPTQWVVNAVIEAYQRGFGVGFNAAGHQMPMRYEPNPGGSKYAAPTAEEWANQPAVRQLPYVEVIDKPEGKSKS